MPPSAAPEWLRVGCSLETMATSAPASWASIAARMPAQPAPITSTSCFASTAVDATRKARLRASDSRAGQDEILVRVELGEVLAEHRRERASLRVVRVRVGPRRARVEQGRVD